MPKLSRWLGAVIVGLLPPPGRPETTVSHPDHHCY
jgi:hypothetical protein